MKPIYKRPEALTTIVCPQLQAKKFGYKLCIDSIMPLFMYYLVLYERIQIIWQIYSQSSVCGYCSILWSHFGDHGHADGRIAPSLFVCHAGRLKCGIVGRDSRSEYVNFVPSLYFLEYGEQFWVFLIYRGRRTNQSINQSINQWYPEFIL